jgi:hypothetical protein
MIATSIALAVWTAGLSWVEHRAERRRRRNTGDIMVADAAEMVDAEDSPESRESGSSKRDEAV